MSNTLDPVMEVMTKGEAEAKVFAEAKLMKFRVASRDGEKMMMSMDYDSNRLNVELQNGVVVKAFIG